MKATDPLTTSQLAQRIDELQDLVDAGADRDTLLARIDELTRAINRKMSENTFNKGVVTPLPPDHLDNDNPYVITPKAPDQVEREIEDWQKRLDR